MQLRDTYNLIAEDWHADHKLDDWWVASTDEFLRLLKPGDLVLDAGCGAGTKTDYLIRNGVRVIGIDFSEKILEIAKSEVPNAEFRLLDMHNSDMLTESFNGIFIQAALLHI